MAGDGGAHKHHAKIKTADSGMPIKQVATVGIVVAILGGGALWMLNRAGEDNKLNTMFASKDVRNISTSNGQSGDVTLSDGTKLKIGAATKLTIIPKYNELYRGVKVEGTAGFDVKASANIPLEVRAAGASLVINEGAFVVRSFPDESAAIIKLTSGTGEIRAKNVRRQLTAPAAVTIATDSTLTDADATAADVATAWVDGKVVFKGITVKDVIPLFEKYYAMKLQVKDDAILSRPVDMEAQIDSKSKAISALEASAHVKFTYDGTTPTLKDDPAGAAKAAAKKK